MRFEFQAEVWYWRGPAPWYFVTVPEFESNEIKEVQSLVTYGWGMIPVMAKIGVSEWKTALWPKDERFILPLNAAIRRAEAIEERQMLTAYIDVFKASGDPLS
jgi:hypothetical protein